MSWIANMKIMTKLVSVFIFIAILSAVVGIFGIKNMLVMDKSETAMYEENVEGILAVSNMNDNFLSIRLNMIRVLSRTGKEEQLKNIESAKSMEVNFEKSMSGYEKTITAADDRAAFNELKESYDKYNSVIDETEKGILAGKSNSELEKDMSNYYALGDKLEESVNKLFKINEEQAKSRSDINTVTASKAINIMTILVVISSILSVILGIIISLSISRPINKLAEAGEKLSLGDVNIDIKSKSTDEIGILTKSFEKLISAIKEQANVIQKVADGDLTVNIKIRSEADIVNKKIEQMLIKNNTVFGEIRKAAEQVNSAAEQVAQGSTALAQASTEQSATVEEISATVEEIASQSKENASGARNANELATEARISSETGSAQMKNMMNSMEEINDASRSISKIIKVIDDIAFQTNILALNAAVEAARAGSHGKGFAVVAEEVRNLAARSAKAASETTDLIESTIAKVNAGTKIATDTASALTIINDKIGKVTEMIEDIAISSGEQATAVAQVSLGVSQVSGAIQTNSATAEESAAASEELSAQATMLKQSVASFKLKENNSNRSNHTYNEIQEKNISEVLESNMNFMEDMGKY